MLIEGMTIAGIAVGATKGYVYVRSEYPHAIATLNAGDRAAPRPRASSATTCCGSGKRFRLEVRKGAGSYVCGEETALLESLEGKRGIVRAKPPLPAIEGLFGKPTRDQQRDHLRQRADHPRARRGVLPATTAWAVRAARCRSSWPATSSTAGWSRRPSASPCASCSTTSAAASPVGPADQGGAGRRPAGRLPARIAVGHAARLRGLRRGRRAWSATAASWCTTTRADMAAAGALRDGVLRHRILRQVHAVPHRLDARRRGHRPHPRRRRTARSRSMLLRDLCDTMVNGSLCAMGGMTPYPGAVARSIISRRTSACAAPDRAAPPDARGRETRHARPSEAKPTTARRARIDAARSRSRSTASRSPCRPAPR